MTLSPLSLHFLKKKRGEKKVKVVDVGNIFVPRVRVQHCTCVRVLVLSMKQSSQLTAHSLTRAVLLCCSLLLCVDYGE